MLVVGSAVGPLSVSITLSELPEVFSDEVVIDFFLDNG
jgi:hypothetical protein